mmetsp:Transcript_31920/g.93970  ORF Transcript_31920/g.93970 Transcript_31920/m.93970 type:complete len:224 (-) Transcript_31920:32-703(-)
MELCRHPADGRWRRVCHQHSPPKATPARGRHSARHQGTRKEAARAGANPDRVDRDHHCGGIRRQRQLAQPRDGSTGEPRARAGHQGHPAGRGEGEAASREGAGAGGCDQRLGAGVGEGRPSSAPSTPREHQGTLAGQIRRRRRDRGQGDRLCRAGGRRHAMQGQGSARHLSRPAGTRRPTCSSSSEPDRPHTALLYAPSRPGKASTGCRPRRRPSASGSHPVA